MVNLSLSPDNSTGQTNTRPRLPAPSFTRRPEPPLLLHPSMQHPPSLWSGRTDSQGHMDHVKNRLPPGD